jgi:hypothetical protein
VKKEHADSTKEKHLGSDDEMDKVEASLFSDLLGRAVANNTVRHCECLGEDRLRFLVQATKEDIKTFLMWILDVHPRVRKKVP